MCDWRLSHLKRLILVTYASSQWRGKMFLIEHVVNVKTLNGSEHDGRSFKRWYGFYAFTGGRERTFHIFFIEIENFRGEGKILKRHTHDNFFWKNSWFFQNFRRERTVFPFIFKENGKSEAVFEHFWSARQQFFFERGVTQIWSLFYCKTDNLTCLNKTNCLVNSKVKEFFMCFYVICMNKHVGITLLVFSFCLFYTQALVARTTPFF